MSADELLLGAPGHRAERRVGVDDVALERDERDAERRALERGAEPRLGLDLRVLGGLLLGDVAGDDDQAAHGRVVDLVLGGAVEPEVVAVDVAQPEPDRLVLAAGAGQDLAERRAGELDVVGMHEREDAALGVPAIG